MVRVGGLTMAQQAGSQQIDPAGLSVSEQLERIEKTVRILSHEQYVCFDLIERELEFQNIHRIDAASLTDEQANVVQHVFVDQIQAVLTPMAVRRDQTFPLLLGGTINVCVRLAPEKGSEEPRFAIIPFGRSTLRFVTVPSSGGYSYVLVEDVVSRFVQSFFPGEEVVSTACFRITRNADMSINEDEAADFMTEIEDVLTERCDGFCVRLELSSNPCQQIQAFLQQALKVTDRSTYVCDGPLGLAAFSQLTSLPGFERLRFPDWASSRSPNVDPARPLLDQIRERDILLHHPYESYDTVVRFVEDAAVDPDVVAIKQTLYRTSRRSPIVNALMQASENGKQVTVLVELKARFDEQRNIDWAKQLEQSGVQVIYGVLGLKTHAKVCVVIRREPQGFQRYVHFGTGNYNEITSRFYTDISYFTARNAYGADAVACFNAICGYSQPQNFSHLSTAPIAMRQKLLEMIHVERTRCEKGHEAKIYAKMNSLVDPGIIRALYDASQAGVEIKLNVRGICCLKPGVPGLSENITVVSIVDRYLEHSRIMYFHHGGDGRVFISSADWMPRNLDRRIELLVPVEDLRCRKAVIEILRTSFADTEKGRTLQSDGTWTRIADGTNRAQAVFHQQAVEAAQAAAKARRTVFVPHQAPNVG